MEGSLWSSRRKIRSRRVESYNREGHWVRKFSVRGEAWPTFESWASEKGYHLIAIRGNRRLYKREPVSANWSTTFLDIRQETTHIILHAWIHFGRWPRWMTLFFTPSQMRVEPMGYLGIRKRREACRDLNDLLDRFHQKPIVGSDTFHWADWDLTTLGLVTACTLFVLSFIVASAQRLTLAPGLTGILLLELGKKIGGLIALASGLIALQNWVIVRRWGDITKISAAVGMGLLFGGLALWLSMRTGYEMLETKITHFCIYQYREGECQKALDVLTAPQREVLEMRIRRFDLHLTTKKSVAKAPVH